MTLSSLSVRRPVLAAVLSLMILVLGLGGLARLPIRELPDVETARAIALKRGGIEIPNSIPKATRAVPFGDLSGVLGTGGDRWVALNCKVAHSDASRLIQATDAILLGRLGAEAETTGTASEGVALLTDSPFDAVLLDIKPPDMGGYEAYRRLREAREQGPPIAMMAVFGYDAGHAIVKARQDGMKHVIFKPFRQEQLVNAVLDGTAPPYVKL